MRGMLLTTASVCLSLIGYTVTLARTLFSKKNIKLFFFLFFKTSNYTINHSAPPCHQEQFLLKGTLMRVRQNGSWTELAPLPNAPLPPSQVESSEWMNILDRFGPWHISAVFLTWVRPSCGGWAPRRGDGCTCPHSWSSQSASSPPPATPTVQEQCKHTPKQHANYIIGWENIMISDPNYPDNIID